jgi:UDP-N-acetylglucosamine enolpyruvyl transferase
MVYIAPIGSKHKNESLFQNLVVDIVEVQTLRGIILLKGDFNARIATLPDTIHTSGLCELLQVPKLMETKQLSILTKRQNRASVGG